MGTSSRQEATDDDRWIEREVHLIEAELVQCRREVHRHAESAWTEFWTTSYIAKRLAEFGYNVLIGPDVCCDSARMGVPPDAVVEQHRLRALDQGDDADLLKVMRGGFTGAIGTRSQGRGPVIALRFDIDALELLESNEASHRPTREGFASLNDGVCHACGHDGHVAIGLGVASVLSHVPAGLPGTLRLIFQPAEEGVRGARAIVAAGHLSDVDYVVGCHLLSGLAVGEFVSGLGGYAATRKFDVRFLGEAAHAGGSPEGGRNALLAAATAALHLHALPRHHGGLTRVHVGRMDAGTGRNVIPDRALLVAEVRGGTGALCQSMYERAERVVAAAAAMYGCAVSITPMGQADTAQSDPYLARRVENAGERVGPFTFHDVDAVGGSEDFTEMMRAVQARGGLATSVGIGADFHGISRDDVNRSSLLAPHSGAFDFDERALGVAVRVLSCLVIDLAREAQETT
jgi:aminobenzoyl-glutamate utilization protein A